uniref:Uncharacterized protein n=1 Tax=Arundo donax TaxID=35708 RepID=A0A0A9UGQ1_ARUDO
MCRFCGQQLEKSNGGRRGELLVSENSCWRG